MGLLALIGDLPLGALQLIKGGVESTPGLLDGIEQLLALALPGGTALFVEGYLPRGEIGIVPGQIAENRLLVIDHSAELDLTEAQESLPDETEIVRKLEDFREATGALKDLSFDTIAGAASNGAIVHYRPTERLKKRAEKDSLLLVDSGAQYLDGTTDVTRTVAIGEPSAEMKQRFTLVLKGNLALARVRFPAGTTGSALDALARMALWENGLDYDHGTGHGVGSYLGVHEGPQRISKAPSTVALKPGMIVSNEPGYYKEGGYGIRIENLQVVTEAQAIEGGERPMHGFETLTLAPFDRRCIDTGLLTPEETAQLDAYHARVREVIGAQLDDAARAWLDGACAPI